MFGVSYIRGIIPLISRERSREGWGIEGRKTLSYLLLASANTRF